MGICVSGSRDCSVRRWGVCKGPLRSLRGLPLPCGAQRQGTAVGDVMALLALRASLLAAPRSGQGWAPKWNARADPCGAPDCERGQCAWEGATCRCAARGRRGPQQGRTVASGRDTGCMTSNPSRASAPAGRRLSVQHAWGRHATPGRCLFHGRVSCAAHALFSAERLTFHMLDCRCRLGLL